MQLITKSDDSRNSAIHGEILAIGQFNFPALIHQSYLSRQFRQNCQEHTHSSPTTSIPPT